MEYPSLDTAKAGAIRFNTDSSQLEIYDGNQWVGVLATSPELQTDGKYSNAGTRGIVMGGPAPGEPAGTNMMQYLSIATTGDTGDFGDLTRKKYASYGGISSRTRGIMPGGYFYNQPSGPGTYIDDIDAFTISIKSNAFDFGNLTQARQSGSAMSSPTRGVIYGGYFHPSYVKNEFITIASTGNAQEFGDAYDKGGNRYNPSGVSNSIRGLMAGGLREPSQTKYIESYQLATLGKGINFGDLSTNTRSKNGTASPVRGVFAGGRSPADPGTTGIEYVSMQTEGDAVDFGDLTQARYEHAPMGNAHGGLG